MKLKAADIFSDHMVLRHSRLNPVWGTAEPGARIRARLGDFRADCAADENGRWILWLGTPPAGTVTRLVIGSETETVAFHDVACGEVWLAGGQSNMEQPLMCMEGASPWAGSASRAQVRLKRIPRRCGRVPEPGWHFFPDDGLDSPWMHADRGSAARFSAVGYVFGAYLSERLGMPVGVIECNWGGTMIQSWMPPEEIRSHADTAADLDAFLSARAALGGEAREAFLRYADSVRRAAANEPDYVDRNLRDPLNFLKEDRNIRFVPFGADGDPQMPGILFESMVRRAAPYGLNGVLWYQGEANGNCGEAPRYSGLFRRMLKSWRDAWMDPRLPFLTCQLAGFNTSLYWKKADWPALRACQQECADMLRGVSMAVLIDVGMRENIHPLYKQPVAERLFRLALEDVHGIPSEAHPPRPLAAEHVSDGVRLRFDRPVSLREGALPVLLAREEPLPCRAVQTGPRTLLLRCPEGPGALPTAVGYAQCDWLIPGLFGQNGLPAAPFLLPLRIP